METITRTPGTVGWDAFAAEQPELAGAVRARLEGYRHHVLATLRRDGAPRASGTEVDFYRGELLLGSMLNSVKALDLLRDGRFGLHGNPGDGSMDGGDIKLSGTAVDVTDAERDRYLGAREAPPGPFHLFRLDLESASVADLTPERDAMRIRWWRPGTAVREVRRT